MRPRLTWILVCGLTAMSCGRRQPAAAPQLVSEIAIGDTSQQTRLLHGFYESTGGWRWTDRTFAVSLDAPASAPDVFLELDFNLPLELMNPSGTVTLTALVNGVEVGKRSYSTTGRRILAFHLPGAALRPMPALVVFQLDKSVKDGRTGRPYGLIAHNVGLKTREETTAYRESYARLAQEGYRNISRQRGLNVSLERELEFMKLFHQLPVWQNIQFHNVRLVQNPLDLWVMQQVIYEVQPEFIVETGTWRGGSALYCASLLDGMRLSNSRVLTVDIQDSTQRSASHPLWKRYVDFYLGSSTDSAIVSGIAKRVEGHKTIVMLDSDHAMRHVLKELQMYSPLVSRGSYIVVEDTHIDGVPTYPEDGPAPMAATIEFLKSPAGRDFERDLSREKFLMSFYPGGWLRRK